MPKRIDLTNQNMSVERGSELDSEKSEQNGAPVMADIWTIVFTDKTYGDQIRISFRKEVRDAFVRDLMGGVILAGGEQLPSI